jgi:hypothetical protein
MYVTITPIFQLKFQNDTKNIKDIHCDYQTSNNIEILISSYKSNYDVITFNLISHDFF